MNEVKILLKKLDELHISKVELANYLKVSRQMVYNYLSMKSFSEWPIKKRIKMLDLLEVNNFDEIEDLKIDSKLLQNITQKLASDEEAELLEGYKVLDDTSKCMVHDVIRLCEDETTRDYINVLLTLIEHAMISKDYKFLILYLSKTFEKTDPREFCEEEAEQMAFEGILFSAFNLFNSSKYSKDKTARVHEQFVKELENKKHVDPELTNTINITKFLAKNELGIEKIDDTNIDLVLEKMLEIQSRKL